MGETDKIINIKNDEKNEWKEKNWFWNEEIKGRGRIHEDDIEEKR